LPQSSFSWLKELQSDSRAAIDAKKAQWKRELDEQVALKQQLSTTSRLQILYQIHARTLAGLLQIIQITSSHKKYGWRIRRECVICRPQTATCSHQVQSKTR
ncbi:hypothetical protein GOODEAATRI_026690, partial [Goodea atripinnis]